MRKVQFQNKGNLVLNFISSAKSNGKNKSVLEFDVEKSG